MRRFIWRLRRAISFLFITGLPPGIPRLSSRSYLAVIFPWITPHTLLMTHGHAARLRIVECVAKSLRVTVARMARSNRGGERHRRRGDPAPRGDPPDTADQRLLDSRSRGDWKQKDAWRALRILSEFVEGFDTLADLPPAVSVFGSARSKPDSPECELAADLGRGAGRGRLRGHHRRRARA